MDTEAEEEATAAALDADEEGTAQQQNGSPRHTHPGHVFILAGQSNMAGRGGVHRGRWDGVVPPEGRPRPVILRFSARSHWVEAREPLHADIDTSKTCGVGPGMAFANAVLPHLLPSGFSSPDPPPDAAVVGLVPCAVGGTAIRKWERGTRLYGQLVRRAKEAVRVGGELRAVLWYQGESDTASHQAADAYGANIERLIRDLRADLGLPLLPFVQVAIISGDGAYVEMVRQAQLGLNMPNVACVDAIGLPLNEDHLHLTTEAQVRLGCMLAEAYIKNFFTSAALAQATPPRP